MNLRPSRHRRRLLGALGAFLAVFALSACRIDAVVTVDMNDDGSGTLAVTITLDADAVAAAEIGGGTLDERFRLGDLSAAGWSIGSWERSDDGSATLELVHPFGTPEELVALTESVNGTSGPVPELSVTRSEGFFETRFEAEGVVDLDGTGAGVAADEELAAALVAAGADPVAVDESLTSAARREVAVSLEVKFPDGTSAAVTAEPGERAELSGSASVGDSGRITLLIVAAGLVGLAVVVVVVGRGLDRHRRRSSDERSGEGLKA